MAVTLEWVTMPEGWRFRTVCRGGVPWMEPTRFLMECGHLGVGSSRTIDTYAERLLPFCKWLDRKHLALGDLGPSELHRFQRDLVLSDPSQPPLLQKASQSSDVTIRATIAIALRLCERSNGRHEAPATGSRMRPTHHRPHLQYRQKRRLPKTLTQAQLDHCRDWIMDAYAFDPHLQLRNRAIFEVLWDGALRVGGMLSLRTTHIHWLEHRLTVSFLDEDYEQGWQARRRPFRTAKTGEYPVALSPPTLLWMNRYFVEARPVEAVGLNHGFFFCEHRPGRSDHGAPLSIGTVRYLFRSLSKPAADGGAGIHVTPHMLRHTWATMALEDGLPREVVQYQLGHRSAQSTTIYTHVSPEWVRDALAKWHRSRIDRHGKELS